MTEVTIEPVRDGDLAEILRNFERFWGDHPHAEMLRHFHHPMFFREFADTAFVARRRPDGDSTDGDSTDGDSADGEIAGYLLGFVAPTGDGYIHFIAVRDDGRGLGLGRRLYETFTAVALDRGATALKALTSTSNEGSIAFHRRMGFTEMTLDEDYAGSGRTRVVMRRPLATRVEPLSITET
jgi:ribosomal protein S18 acetylase RimI-like enzyme